MIRPSRARFLLAEQPEPLVLALPAPTCDAFELYRRLAVPGRPSFLLESGSAPGTTARYTFIGSDPYLVLSGKDRRYTLRTRESMSAHEGHPFRALAELVRSSRWPRPDGLPPFFGGAVGFLSYDLVRCFERLPDQARDDLSLPDLEFAFFDLVAALDYRTQTMSLIFAPPLDRLLGEPRDKLYREGCDRLAALEARLSAPAPVVAACADSLAFTAEQTRLEYMERVRACQELIAAGDIYQANLSHRFTMDHPSGSSPDPPAVTRSIRQGIGPTGAERFPGQELAHALYGRLREMNPSPFSAVLAFDDVTLVGCSPERLVRLDGRRVETRPIAGTRPRGRTLDDDRRLVEDLLTNSKERAEHLMLVDLERNDLGRVCHYGTVRVDQLMVVERYSHVSHIVSNVSGDLHEQFDGFDLVRAVFPGGTITGVPKIRCMELLDRLEPVRRGPYTGSLGYFSWSGDLDLNIIIRTLVLMRERGYLQVGAGIVADSDPMTEYDETLYKAEAFFEALKRDVNR